MCMCMCIVYIFALSFLTTFYMYKRILNVYVLLPTHKYTHTHTHTHTPNDMFAEVANLSFFIFPLVPNFRFVTVTYFIVSYTKTFDSQLKTVLHVCFY